MSPREPLPCSRTFGRIRASTLLLLPLLCALPAIVAAQEPCADGKLQCVLDDAQSLLDAGNPGQALAFLKGHAPRLAESRPGTLLLARAYAGTGNRVWARRTLTRYLSGNEADCEVRAHLAWLALEDADYRGAREVLESETCPATSEERTRWHLLTAMAEHEAERHPEAARLLGDAAGQPVAYPEDRAFLTWLTPRVRPLRTPPLELRAELAAGWTSNPLLGSPLDPQATEGDYSSAKSEGDLWLKAATPSWGPFRTFVEATGKYQYLLQEPASDLSYAGWGLRPGIELEWLPVALRMAYRFDSLFLSSGDAHHEGGHWFSEAHRGEMELESALGVTLFGGAGRRTFGALGRSRWEVDGGVGGGLHLGKGIGFLGAATARRQWANSEAYDLVGGSLLVALSVPLPARFTARASFSTGIDWYPHSAGALAFHSPEERRDIQLRGKIALWSPALVDQLRLAVVYEPVRRFSTADLYDFSDQGVLLVLGWRGNDDPWLPRTADGPPGRIPIDFGMSGNGGMAQDRLQDLLRQDEEAQRGSSCLD